MPKRLQPPALLLAAALAAALPSAPLAAQAAARPAAVPADPIAALTRPRTRAPRPTTAEITLADLQSRLYRFADDSMQGRLMGTPGNVKGAEYIAAEGNYNIFLCERGVRTFSNHTRNTLDLSAVPAVKSLSHLPIIVDPSHGTGKRDKVIPMARAAAAAGADGLMVEVHANPDRALSDGPQALLPDQFDTLMGEVRAIAALVGRTL